MSATTKRAIAITALAAALIGGGALACRRDASVGAGSPASQQLYQCPMHPTYVSDRPGQCPICKMDLVPMTPPVGAASPASSGAPTGSRKVLFYRSPMNPSIHSPVPSKDEMGMDYVPVYEDEAIGQVVSGRAMVALSPERRQLLGVRSEPVARRHLERTIRTVGRVAVDERLLHHVHTKYEAYVEKLYVNFVGQFVRKGDHLAALYSPELVATQQEYLLAYRAQQSLAGSSIASVARGASDLLEAARQRLLFWDMDPEDIAALARTGRVSRTVDLHAELPGYVIQKAAIHGMRVTPADTLFDIADLSRVWILADISESDLPLVSVGMASEATLPYEAGRTWRGSVAYVDPLVDPATRTVKARIDVVNADMALKPDMFATVLLRRDLGLALFVPESAVLKPGDRQLVFVDLGDGRLEPRDVATGERVEGGYAVLSGLREGERVVTSANFLIDSESSLKAAIAVMGTPPAARPAHQD
jgi:RND family efflux transporter MFP subunit